MRILIAEDDDALARFIRQGAGGGELQPRNRKRWRAGAAGRH